MPKVKLNDVAVECKETIKGETGLPVVGLEHLIPGEVCLTQWSDDTNNTFTKRFRKGQVVFGRRRAYLKKAAVASFDGICSGDITVIAARPEVLEPELLPFIIQNDALFDYAVGHSAGSLSPRVKWEHLKNYEFQLPDRTQQCKLARLLWEVENTRRAYQTLIQRSEELVKSQFIEEFGDAERSQQLYPLMKISEVCDVIQDGEHATVKRVDEGNLFISSRNIKTDHTIVLDNITYVSNEDFDRIRKRFAPDTGDIILTCAGTIGNSAVVPEMEPFVADRGLAMLRPKQSVISSLYLHACIISEFVQGQMQAGIHATALAHLYLNKINAIKVIVPPMEKQKRFEVFVQQLDKSKHSAQKALQDLQATQKALIRKYLG